MKDLILAVSYGYTRVQLGVFLGSLKASGFSGDLVLFVGGTDRHNIDQIRAAGAKIIPFSYPYRNCTKLRNPLHPLWMYIRRFLKMCGGNIDLLQTLAAPFLNLGILRFLFYRNFLQRYGDDYGSVFLTDLRDVCFQASPFEAAPRGQLRVYLEEAGPTLGACPNNSRWIMELYGDEELAKLSSYPIICAGTTLGSRDKVVGYLDAFVRSLPEARSVMRMGVDQGIHNYLIRNGRCPEAVLCPNRFSEVLTMGFMGSQQVSDSYRSGVISDSTGRPYAVIHQFDRHAEVAQAFADKYLFH